MPLPIGHALAGIAMRQARPAVFFAKRWADVLFFVFLANLPDADFLPGILLGRPSLYHHGIFHSLGAAVATAIVGGGLFYLRAKKFRAATALIFLVYSGHLLLDFFARDAVAPYGLPMFWPLSRRYFIAARPIFLNVTRSQRSHDFFASLFSNHNLEAALREIAILGGLALAVVLLRRWLQGRRSGH
jgi:inner membrane protein